MCIRDRLKAFLEQIARPGFAFNEASGNPFGVKGLRGRSARVIVTMGMPALVYRWLYRAHSVKSLERNILGFVGISPVNETLIGGVDGIAFDNKETLYLAVHGQDRIVTIDKKGKAKVVAQGGPLQQPSSLVFGATKKSEKTLYIANFSILAALGVKPGPPTPAVLTLPVKQKGLSLP